MSKSGGNIQDQIDTLQVERYDVDANTWTRLVTQDMPFHHHRGSAAAVENVIYFFGGYESDGRLSDKVSAYDMSQQLWKTPSQMEPLMAPR